MKIVLCVNHYAPLVGGAESVVKTIAEYLAPNHEVFVLTRRVRNRDFRNFKNYNVVEYLPGDHRLFWSKIQSISPDLVMVYSDVFDFFRHITTTHSPFRLLISLCGANWIHKNRSFANLFTRNIRNVEKIICHSEHERDYRLCSTPRLLEKTAIIPNGVHIEDFEANNKTREDLSPDILDKRWILNVANFFPGKGQMHVAKIISSLPDPENIAYIQISNDIDFAVGEKLENEWKKEVALKLKPLGITTKLLKNLPRENVVGYFKQSNVFVCGSEKEVAPLVLLECMASKLPWTAMNVGNAVELKGGRCVKTVKDRNFNCYFDDRAKKLLVNAVSDLLRNPNAGEEGYRQIQDQLRWDKILPLYSNLIEK